MSLSYQHIYHAGNPADIHKHLWLMAILKNQVENNEKVFFFDTHGGRGIYDLDSPEAFKTKDADAGIHKIWDAKIKNSLWLSYQNLIRKCNTGEDREGGSFYPGSSYIAALILRKSDDILCTELHQNEFWHLRKNMRRFKNTLVEKKDMMTSLISSLRPKEKAGCVLIDPSYEIKSEYEDIPNLVMKAAHEWAKGTFVIWYPMLPAKRHEILKEKMENFHGTYIVDEWVYGSGEGRGMYGSGIIVINAPETVHHEMEEVKKLLLPKLL